MRKKAAIQYRNKQDRIKSLSCRTVRRARPESLANGLLISRAVADTTSAAPTRDATDDPEQAHGRGQRRDGDKRRYKWRTEQETNPSDIDTRHTQHRVADRGCVSGRKNRYGTSNRKTGRTYKQRRSAG